MFKSFFEWITLKRQLHEESSRPLFFKENDVWWCAVGENIGIEINGKGSMFSRPVYVYRKLNRNGFLGIPLSTKNKEGSWYVSFVFRNKHIHANLAQIRIFSSSRMYTKMGSVDSTDAQKIKDGFLRLYS